RSFSERKSLANVAELQQTNVRVTKRHQGAILKALHQRDGTTVDRDLKFGDDRNTPCLRPVGSLAKKPSTALSHGRGWREVEGPTQMSTIARTVFRWERARRLIEKADEFLMPTALHVAADNCAIEDIEGGEQRGRAVAVVVVRHRYGDPLH